VRPCPRIGILPFPHDISRIRPPRRPEAAPRWARLALEVPRNWIWMQVAIVFFVLVGMIIAIAKLV
jgi:hypothetical protein